MLLCDARTCCTQAVNKTTTTNGFSLLSKSALCFSLEPVEYYSSSHRASCVGFGNFHYEINCISCRQYIQVCFFLIYEYFIIIITITVRVFLVSSYNKTNLLVLSFYHTVFIIVFIFKSN